MSGLFQMGGSELDLLNTRRMQEELAKMNEQMNSLPTYQAPAPIEERSVQSSSLPPVQPAEQPKPSFMQRIGTKLKDPAYRAQLAAAFNTMRLNPDPNMAQRASDMRKEQKSLQGANQTVAYLERIGRTDLADLVRQQPSLAPEVLKSILTQQGKQETFGTSLHYFRDADGKLNAFQVGNLGSRADTQLPEGATPVSPIDTALAKKFSVSEIEYALQKEREGQEGLAVLQKQLGDLDTALNDEEIMKSIYSKVGTVQSRIPSVTDEQAKGESYIKNFAAQSFMRAFEMLKGGGQITEKEGQAAAAAVDRLQSFILSDEDYKKAMEDAKDALQDLVDLSEARIIIQGKKLQPYRDQMNQMLGLGF